jgi:UDP-2,3-diacylglucosamine hydrolase
MDLLASDLHLSAATPALNAAFLALLEGRARHARRIFLLGDLFELWAGDEDAARPEYRPVIRALRDLVDGGRELHVLPGNRDFLMGRGFAETTGAVLHGDTLVTDIAGRRTLLLHGDTLCTDDTAYQQFRTLVRNPAWQAAFLAKPLAERHAIAEGMRARSREATAGKDEYILDAHPEAIAEAFRTHQVTRMIHGHTHRPARHTCTDGAPDATRTRWVLADWRDRACWLEADDEALHAFTTDDRGICLVDGR